MDLIVGFPKAESMDFNECSTLREIVYKFVPTHINAFKKWHIGIHNIAYTLYAITEAVTGIKDNEVADLAGIVGDDAGPREKQFEIALIEHLRKLSPKADDLMGEPIDPACVHNDLIRAGWHNDPWIDGFSAKTIIPSGNMPQD